MDASNLVNLQLDVPDVLGQRTVEGDVAFGHDVQGKQLRVYAIEMPKITRIYRGGEEGESCVGLADRQMHRLRPIRHGLFGGAQRTPPRLVI